MSSPDRGHTILLSHLHSTSSTLPLETIQSALAHHLSTANPLATPLAATAISAPFYLSQPFTHAKLQSFSTAFRHATHLKYHALQDLGKTRSTLSSILGRSLETILGQWITDVLNGVQGGHPVLRLSSCTGLLQGIEDVKKGEKGDQSDGMDVGNARAGVEDETVVALAEVMDTYASSLGSSASGSAIEEWEREFQPAGQDILSLALVLASESMPLVAQHRLEALPLPGLARILSNTIQSTFKHGTFLSSVSGSVTLSPEKLVHISPSSQFAQTLQAITSSPLTASIAPLSRLTANVLVLLLESPRSSNMADNLYTISDTLDAFREMAKVVERDWISCPLASLTDAEIAADSIEITKSMWTTLKMFLFCNIMLANAVLSASVYLPLQSYDINPTTLALQTLHTLSHLSFVISEFGGVTTTTQGFEHLKKTFYIALDILAQGAGEFGSVSRAEAFVQQTCLALSSQREDSAKTHPRQAKLAFSQAAIEQLVPVLSDKCIRNWVWGICYPHLQDSSHRETYESSHSVVLAIFASYAQRQQQTIGSHLSDPPPSVASSSPGPLPVNPRKPTQTSTQQCAERLLSTVQMTGGGRGINGNDGRGKIDGTDNVGVGSEESEIAARFIEKMVPFYAKCLVENSMDGKLNTTQLRLAYAALMRSASVIARTGITQPYDDHYTLAWSCVQLLLDAIHELLPRSSQHGEVPGSNTAAGAASSSKGKSKAVLVPGENVAERVHRLQLMLISSVSSLPLPLMLRALDEIRTLITDSPAEGRATALSSEVSSGVKSGGDVGADATGSKMIDPIHKSGSIPTSAASTRKVELVEELFNELLEKTGSLEKEEVMRWWYKHREGLLSSVHGSGIANDGKRTSPFSWFKSQNSGLEKEKDHTRGIGSDNSETRENDSDGADLKNKGIAEEENQARSDPAVLSRL